MRLLPVGTLVLLALGTVARAADAPRGYWLEPEPKDPREGAIRDVISKSAFGGPAATADALLKLSAAKPGDTASGLAQLAAGLLLVEAGKPALAIAPLSHPDVARTALADYALLGLARAQEATSDAAAAQNYLAAADAHAGGPVACEALFRAAEVLTKAARIDQALPVLERALAGCPNQAARTLLAEAVLYERQGDLRAAALAYDRIDAERPASPEAREAAKRLRVLGAQLPPLDAEARAQRDLSKALALFDAERWAEAAALLRSLDGRKLKTIDKDLVRVRLGRALLGYGHAREADAGLASVAESSVYAAEAAFHRARIATARTWNADAFDHVATRFPATPWGEEALLTLANHHQKDAKDEDALPYFRRLLEGYPDGRYVERALWRVAWADYRAGRFEDAAKALEWGARTRTGTSVVGGALYWAGRSRAQLGQTDRARQLLREAVQRFKYSYYGLRAGEALARFPVTPPVTAPALAAPAGPDDIPEPQATRLRQLLLIDRFDEAKDELAAVPPSKTAEATLAWIESRRGRLRPALIHMKRAYPEYVSEAGDRLPGNVWRIMYPLDYSGLLLQKSAEAGLDAALVAALICQESTFDPGALSPAGARGLMQVIPKTGRTLARALRVPYTTQALFDPAVSINFGTYYLRDLFDRFGGRVERVLAAYNAGPHRVDAWTAGRPDMSAEEFIESIPFTETRLYVMTILSSQEQYRRIYSLPQAPTTASTAGPAEALSR